MDDEVVNYESVNSLEVPIRILAAPKTKQVLFSQKMESSDNLENTKQELQDAKARLELLEQKLAVLEGRIPQKYPDVEYLGYKDRKRILVCIFIYINIVFFDINIGQVISHVSMFHCIKNLLCMMLAHIKYTTKGNFIYLCWKKILSRVASKCVICSHMENVQ